MNGYDRIKSMVKDQKDEALKQTVNYLLSRPDLEQKFLNEDKNLDEMCKFIKEKGRQHCHNGWNYITNELVYAWAVMYFSLPNSFLKIKSTQTKNILNKVIEPPNGREASLIKDVTVARAMDTAQKTNCLVFMGTDDSFFPKSRMESSRPISKRASSP